MATEKKTNVEKIVESIEKLTVLELSELVRKVEDRFGVTAQASPVMVAQAAGPDAEKATAETKEEKTEFDVHLASVGDKKIQVVKVVRALTGLGLKEAKELVDKAPGNVKEAVPKTEAEEAKTKLEEVGAIVEIR